MNPQEATELTFSGKATIGGSLMAYGGGFWTFVGTHHQEIGAICAMIGAACTVTGLMVAIFRGPRK